MKTKREGIAVIQTRDQRMDDGQGPKHSHEVKMNVGTKKRRNEGRNEN